MTGLVESYKQRRRPGRDTPGIAQTPPIVGLRGRSSAGNIELTTPILRNTIELMPPAPAPTVLALEHLRRYDSCTLSNAIERLGIRPRNEGFVDGTISCRFPQLPPAVGYAVTGRIRTYDQPMDGQCYHENLAWWHYLETIPKPRMVVLQDVDDFPGFGALFGEVHARICRALGCVGYLTNGAVRDLDAIDALGYHLFAGSVSVSHAYAHIVDFGGPVEVGRLPVAPGDLLFGDRHGVLSIPVSAVPRLPEVADELLADERELFQLCESEKFSIDALAKQIQAMARRQRC
jgi:4-hydroxy-4-methyl-2-oxoglutarate aldolase